MKKITLLVSFYIFGLSLFSQTSVNGNQSGTWTASSSPYQVIGDITIPVGQILTIESGVETGQTHTFFK